MKLYKILYDNNRNIEKNSKISLEYQRIHKKYFWEQW